MTRLYNLSREKMEEKDDVYRLEVKEMAAVIEGANFLSIARCVRKYLISFSLVSPGLL